MPFQTSFITLQPTMPVRDSSYILKNKRTRPETEHFSFAIVPRHCVMFFLKNKRIRPETEHFSFAIVPRHSRMFFIVPRHYVMFFFLAAPPLTFRPCTGGPRCTLIAPQYHLYTVRPANN